MKDTNVAAIIIELLVVILFICGIALIAAGLWQVCPPLALIFMGAALVYVAACISKTANSPRKDGKK